LSPPKYASRPNRESIDAIAEATNRDRSFVINEALSGYIDVYRWQVEHIQDAIREADAGKSGA
jgi:predicted transcriptional regulator